MSTKINLGRVKGADATINGLNAINITAGDGIRLRQDDTEVSLTADFRYVQEKLTGEPSQLVGFDEDGNAVPVAAGYELYGFELNMDETNPPSMVKYIEHNVGFEKAGIQPNGEFSYGDWGNAFFIKNLRPCMLYADGIIAYDLDKNDYTKKVDGTPSDVRDDTFDGNAMVGIPTVWVKIDTSVPRKPKFYFANRQLDGGFKAYAHYDANGNVVPYVFLPIYNGWVDSSNRMRSLSRKIPTASQDGTTQITECRANNVSGDDIWDIEKFADRALINMLLTLIGKSTNSQYVFGNGNSNGSVDPSAEAGANGVIPTGTGDTKGLFWGSTTESNLVVKVFGMENWWGNLSRRTLGLVVSNGDLFYKLTSGTEDGSTVTGFDPLSITDNAGAPTGWIKAFTFAEDIFGYANDTIVGNFGIIPSAVGGDSDSKYCDMLTVGTTLNNVANFGGNSAQEFSCGMFNTGLGHALSASEWYIGAAPSCKPNAK